MPRLDADTLRRALEAYAPILVMHRFEAYLPTSVESYLRITQPYTGTDSETGRTWQGLRHRTPLPGAPDGPAQLRGGDPDHAKAYVNVKVGEHTTDLQYWFLYAYRGPGLANLTQVTWNGCQAPMGGGDPLQHLAPGDCELGALGAHEGDWEHFTVTIDNGTGLAAHVPVEEEQLAEGGRVQLYAARNGHALCPATGRSYPVSVKAGPVAFRLLNDTERPGLRLDFRGRCELIGLQGDPALKAALGFREPAFEAAYPGRWGRMLDLPQPMGDVPVLGSLLPCLLRAAGVYDALAFEAGPYPPWSTPGWTAPE